MRSEDMINKLSMSLDDIIELERKKKEEQHRARMEMEAKMEEEEDTEENKPPADITKQPSTSTSSPCNTTNYRNNIAPWGKFRNNQRQFNRNSIAIKRNNWGNSKQWTNNHKIAKERVREFCMTDPDLSNYLQNRKAGYSNWDQNSSPVGLVNINEAALNSPQQVVRYQVHWDDEYYRTKLYGPQGWQASEQTRGPLYRTHSLTSLNSVGSGRSVNSNRSMRRQRARSVPRLNNCYSGNPQRFSRGFQKLNSLEIPRNKPVWKQNNYGRYNRNNFNQNNYRKSPRFQPQKFCARCKNWRHKPVLNWGIQQAIYEAQRGAKLRSSGEHNSPMTRTGLDCSGLIVHYTKRTINHRFTNYGTVV
ncbi:hypothetical protein AAG570_000815 [Ranatra chinensis]|uniref:Uncharacterized protein n=1 Tax=Ranatra chinensis TaxID=642074 RepID=A0ABD0ZAU3_9HEMI